MLSSTGVGYLAHARAERIRLVSRASCQAALGEALVEGPSTAQEGTIELAERVWRGFERAMAKGCERTKGDRCPRGCPGACLRHVVYACASDDANMPETVHRYLRLGFAHGHELRSMLADPVVSAADALARHVAGECEHTRQFVRFSHMADGSFFAVFRPHANTLPLTCGYFAARLATERFCMADPLHGVAVFHDPDCPPAPVRLDTGLMRQLVSRQDLHPDEEQVRAMWRLFYEKTSLEGRGKRERGYDLRASWMPKRFWTGLTELGA